MLSCFLNKCCESSFIQILRNVDDTNLLKLHTDTILGNRVCLVAICLIQPR